MPCPDCARLEPRVKAMEEFCRKVAGSFDVAPAAASTSSEWPEGWPEPPEEIASSSRRSAWRSGFKSRMESKPVTACPYAANSRGHDAAWLQGHEAARAFLRSA